MHYTNATVRTFNKIKKKIQQILSSEYLFYDICFSSKMAVKKHELVHDKCNQLDLKALAQYIQLMNEQPNYLPPPNELVKNCQDIVKCLGKLPFTRCLFFSILLFPPGGILL